MPFAGLAADRLSKAYRDKLMELIDQYVGNINDDHSKIKLDEVRAHLDETYFGWKGDTGADAVFYYRIQSPVILIKFDHQGPIALAGSRKIPTRHHIHTVVRTPSGNDYGKSLLQQHYDMFINDSEHGHTIK